MLAQREQETKPGDQTSITKTIVLNVMVYKRDSAYIAECLDLDIVVREKTETKAIKSLRHAVIGHLMVALSGDSTGLIPRPAPWTHYLLYYFYLAKTKITRNTGLHIGKQPFEVAAPQCYR
jgi:hypothetical protein